MAYRSALKEPARFVYVLIGLTMLLYVVPIYMTLVTALKHPAEISLPTAWLLPSTPHWQSFQEAFAMLLPNFMNSVVLTASGTVLAALIGSINGYAFSKNPFPGSEVVFTLFLFGMFIPYQIILIPLFRALRTMGLYGGVPGLVVAHVVYGIPIVTMLFRGFYDQIPRSLSEQAKLDGAGFFNLYFRIMLPLSASGFVVVGIWQVTQVWNEFLWGVTLARPGSQPITVALAQLAGGRAVNWNLPMAGSIIASIPVVLVYIFLGKYYIRGLLAGSVKE